MGSGPERLDFLLEQVPQPFPDLLVVRLRSTLPEASPWYQELEDVCQRMGRSCQRQEILDATYLAVVVECLGHRTREELRQCALRRRPEQDRVLHIMVSCCSLSAWQSRLTMSLRDSEPACRWSSVWMCPRCAKGKSQNGSRGCPLKRLRA